MSLLELITYHTSIKKNLEIRDIYKLLYQSVFGVEHILKDKNYALERLLEEMKTVEEEQNEELLEEISVTGDVVRVNLRPYKILINNPDGLFNVMLETSSRVKGKIGDFLRLWNDFNKLVKSGKLIYSENEIEQFNARVRRENYPVLSHSERYKIKNKPAYRVVIRDLFINRFKENLKV